MKNENVNTQIDENLKDFINGDKNVLVGTPDSPVSLARCVKNGREYIGSYYGEISVPVTYGPNYLKGKRKIKVPTAEEIRTEKVNEVESEKQPPKGTGGKEAYVMLMTRHEAEIKKLSITAKAILLDMCLGGIQWNTGKLVQNRSRKPHTSLTIAKLIGASERTTKTALKELADKSIIKYDRTRKVYFMNIHIARKGIVADDTEELEKREH